MRASKTVGETFTAKRGFVSTVLAGVICTTFAPVVQATETVRREVGSLVLENVPDTPKELAERLTQYQNVRGATFLDWHPGGKGMLVTTRFGDVQQVHHVPSPGAARRQLTFFEEPVRFAAYDPKHADKGFYFSMDRGGGEFYQLYWFDLAGGRAKLLSDGQSRNESLLVSRKGGRFAYVSTRRNKTDFDLYLHDGPDAKESVLAQELQGQWVVLDWSADDSKILLQRYVSINESYLHVYDIAKKSLAEVRPVRSGGDKVSYGGAKFLGRDAIVATSDEGADFRRLVRIDLKTNASTPLAEGLDWDVDDIAVSPDAKTVAFTVNEGGKSVLYFVDPKQPKKRQPVKLPPAVVSAIAWDAKGKSLAVSFNGAATPEDAWAVDAKTRKAVRWTDSEVGGLDPKGFVSPELVQFRSFDGRQVPAWYYKPKNAAPGAKVPVVISIHGGPEGQAMATFNPLAQFWANELGVATLLPNVRGSAGYGRNYLLLDNGRKREDSVSDIGALLDWVGTRPELDASKVAVFGGSYGGYMVLASMVNFADRIKCGVDIVGISHFVTFLEKTEGYRRDLRRAEYGDERDPEMRDFLDVISPLTNAKKIKAPLFVVQGLNDPRVPVGEAEQIVKTVRGSGVPTWYMLAKDEGHGFAKKRNRDAYQNATVLFLQEFLLK